MNLKKKNPLHVLQWLTYGSENIVLWVYPNALQICEDEVRGEGLEVPDSKFIMKMIQD